jgi:uncharacterized protein (TIGR02284 family)
MLDSQAVIISLNNLIQSLTVEKEYFLNLSESVADDVLSAFCKRRAEDIKKNIYELRKLVYNIGGNPPFTLSFTGFLQSKWKLIKTSVLCNDQFSLVKEIENLSQMLLKVYESVSKKYLPPMVSVVLMRQIDDLRRNVSQCKQLHHHMQLMPS